MAYHESNGHMIDIQDSGLREVSTLWVPFLDLIITDVDLASSNNCFAFLFAAKLQKMQEYLLPPLPKSVATLPWDSWIFYRTTFNSYFSGHSLIRSLQGNGRSHVCDACHQGCVQTASGWYQSVGWYHRLDCMLWLAATCIVHALLMRAARLVQVLQDFL